VIFLAKNYNYTFAFVKFIPEVLSVPFLPDTVYFKYKCPFAVIFTTDKHRNGMECYRKA